MLTIAVRDGDRDICTISQFSLLHISKPTDLDDLAAMVAALSEPEQ